MYVWAWDMKTHPLFPMEHGNTCSLKQKKPHDFGKPVINY